MKLSYLPGILIAAVGVGVQAFDFKGFDTSDKHEVGSYAVGDVRLEKGRVNEMGMIEYRLIGAQSTKRNPFAVGMEAVGTISSVAKGEDISKGVAAVKNVDPITFINSVEKDPKVQAFHRDLGEALAKAESSPNASGYSNQYDQLDRF